MDEELNRLRDLESRVRILADDADRMLLTRKIDDPDVKKLLERLAGAL